MRGRTDGSGIPLSDLGLYQDTKIRRLWKGVLYFCEALAIFIFSLGPGIEKMKQVMNLRPDSFFYELNA